MKKLLTMAFILSLALLVFGCMSPEEKATQNDILTYLEKMASIEEKNTALTQEFMVIENSNDDKEIANLLSEKVLPTTEEISGELAEISVTNEELQPLHQQYISYWEGMNKGLNTLNEGISQMDPGKAEEGISTLKTFSNTLSQYYTNLEKLCTQYNIDLETDEITTE